MSMKYAKINHMSDDDLKKVANFLFEAGMLQKTPRSGFFFLGSGSQSVAEHLNRVGYIGFILAKMNKDADVGKVLEMCMFHDFAEARVSDLNYVHQKYVERRESDAVRDLAEKMPFGDEIQSIIEAYNARDSIEAKLTKDADNLELLLALKEQIDIGNERARTWIPALLPRIKTDEGKKLAEAILETESDEWWYGDKDDDWWVDRNKK